MFVVGVFYYYCLVALVVVWISYWFYSWSNPKTKNGKLPPGSMGFPIIGESLQFFSAYSSHDIPPFIKKRVARYGPLFRTSLVGQKIVISTDNEINYSIFRQENKSFQLWYTDSFGAILGNDESILGHNGKAHNYLKKLGLYLLGPEKLRKNLLQEMEEATCTHLQSWAKNGSFDIRQGSSKLIFELIAKTVMSYDEEKDSKKLGESCKAFIEGLISFPLNIPGTAFYASLQARKKIIKVIKDIYEDRKASRVSRRDDFVDYLIEEVEKEDTFLNDNSAVNIIFGIIFTGAETISQAVTLLLNFVSDRLDVLTELTKEHETILRKRDNENTGITWEEYKSMTFTHMVINEAMRIGNVTPGIFRKVVKDVEMNGYTIPAGWTVMIAPSTVHLNPDKYDNPSTFNPWRWQGQELNKGSKTFMAFGCGLRLCVGAEFAKLQMAIFLHYLVTRYKWSVINGGDFIRRPHLIFPTGMHVQIAEENK